MSPLEILRQRAETLHLHGLLAHWTELADSTWVEPLLAWEETERARRRLGSAHIGRFKPLADFDWHWPTQCDRTAISELMGLDFLHSATHIILVGISGLCGSRPLLRTSPIRPFCAVTPCCSRPLANSSMISPPSTAIRPAPPTAPLRRSVPPGRR